MGMNYLHLFPYGQTVVGSQTVGANHAVYACIPEQPIIGEPVLDVQVGPWAETKVHFLQVFGCSSNVGRRRKCVVDEQRLVFR